MPAGTARAFTRAVMATRRQSLKVRRQRIFERAAGHVERTEIQSRTISVNGIPSASVSASCWIKVPPPE